VAKVMLVGESWSVTSIHAKGFDTFTTVEYAEGGAALIKALEDEGHEVSYMPSHVAATAFPATVEGLSDVDVVLLSDIGSNTLLLPHQTFVQGRVMPNRLEVLSEWVRGGGGFAMIGGYMTFQGIEGKANYKNTVVAEILPVTMLDGDDRVEAPQGVVPEVSAAHGIVDGLTFDAPLLGYQRLVPREDAEVLLTVGEDPLLVLGEVGSGRTLAYASDIGPHWAPTEFTDQESFAKVWGRAADWLAGK
jgi:uncharacterized membrane protein